MNGKNEPPRHQVTKVLHLLGVVVSWWFVLALPAQKLEFRRLVPGVIEERLRLATDRNSKRKAALEKLFEDAGCGDGHLTDQKVKHAGLPNVVCALPGTGDSVILVGAHYDHVAAGKGVVDNWSGAALLPSLFESLRGNARRHTFLFIGFTDEEKGLVGSRFYAGELTPERVAKTRAMVNLDTLGLSGTKVWASHGDPKLVDALFRVAETLHLPLQGVNVEKAGSSDSESFALRGIPSLSIHSITQETLRILHSPADDMKAMKLAEYYDTYRLVVAYLAFLDTSLE